MAKIPAKTSTALKRAKARLKGRWCQGAYYRTKSGKPCALTHRGCCCCAYGALNIVLGLVDTSNIRYRAGAVLNWAANILDAQASSASAYNDAPNRTEAEVLKLFDSAIEYCRKRGD